MKKNLLLSLCAGAIAAVSFGATNPKAEKYAVKITATSTVQTKSVSLYKTTEGSNTLYVCYYALTVKKGSPYTVWISGMKDGAISVNNVYAASATDWNTSAPIALFNATACGEEDRWVLTGNETWSYSWDDWGDDWGDDDWGDDDWEVDWKTTTPNSWTYYVKVVGEKGATATLNYVQKKQIPGGILSNPTALSPKTSVQWAKTKLSSSSTVSGLVFFDNHYYLTAKVKAGQRYHFGTTGGSSDNELTLAGFSNGVLGDYAAWSKDYNGAVSFVPSKDFTLQFHVDSTRGYTDGKSAGGKLRYLVEPSRAIGDHAKTTLKIGRTLTFKPGYLSAPDTGAFDAIVDEGLFKVSLEKKQNYVFETTGSETSLKMYLYDSKGNVLATNTSKGSGSKDVRICVTPTTAGTYYVGVCENLSLVNPEVPTYGEVKISAMTVAKITKSLKLSPLGAPVGQTDPQTVDTTGSSVISLGTNVWYATATFGGVRGMTYAFSAAFTDAEKTESNKLKVVVSYGGKTLKTLKVTPGATFTYTATKNGMYSLRISPYVADGLDFQSFRLHSIGYVNDASGTSSGSLKVNITGASGKWTLKLAKNDAGTKETVQYDSGATVVLPKGSYSIGFTTVKNYTAPATRKASVKAGQLVVVDDNYYNDKWDAKDASYKNATSLSLSTSKRTVSGHTLWKTDAYDFYKFSATKGYHYTFKLTATGDQAFSIGHVSSKGAFTPLALNDSGDTEATSVSRLRLPATSTTYYLRVQHTTDDDAGGAYALQAYYEDLGVVEFVKSALEVKDDATYATLTVRRTKDKGAMCVKFATADSTAKKSVNYIAQSGYLTWKNGDMAKKTITVKLVPKTLPITSKDLKFTVKLTDAHAKVSKGTVARFASNKSSTSATVTIANAKGNFKTVKAAYASVYTDSKKTLKKSETGVLRAGTFYGILAETSGNLTNGAPAFAAMTLTAKAGATAADDTYTAKVQIAGRTYTFKNGAGESNTDLLNVVTVETDLGPQVFTNVLSVAVKDGDMASWAKAGATARLALACLPEASGYQADLVYEGELARRNSKNQLYLNQAFKFDGYYTVSLVPGSIVDAAGADVVGAPEGHGYLTLAVDNAGGVQIAGLLADRTPVAVSATACGIAKDASSAIGYVMTIPVFQADATNCFAAVLKLRAVAESGRVDGKAYKLVFDSTVPAHWNSDDGSKTYGGEKGWKAELYPAGGWYDKLVNLQGYYNKVSTLFDAGVTNFPAELLDEGYSYAAIPFAAVDLAGDKMTAATRVLVTDGSASYDFSSSVNPCNVKVSFKRATGVATGSCSVWVASGSDQREISGFKHFGVLTIDRDDRAGVERPLLDDTLISGSLFKAVKRGEDRTWNLSIPFEVFEH